MPLLSNALAGKLSRLCICTVVNSAIFGGALSVPSFTSQHRNIELLLCIVMFKQWCVYIVKCSDGTLYTGISNDVEGRIRDHNRGRGAKYTKYRSPVSLFYYEAHQDKSSALKREYEIKQMPKSRKEQLGSRENKPFLENVDGEFTRAR